MAQIVKNLPAMQETWVRSLGWEDPLEKGMATHSSNFAYIYTTERYSTIKRKNAICSNMGGSRIIILNKANQTKANIMDITYMWNLKGGIQMNLVYRTEIDPQT